MYVCMHVYGGACVFVGGGKEEREIKFKYF